MLIIAEISSEGKSLGNLQCRKLHLSPNLQASFVSKKDAQYRCDKPVGKNNFFPVVFMMESARFALAPSVFLHDPPPLPCFVSLGRGDSRRCCSASDLRPQNLNIYSPSSVDTAKYRVVPTRCCPTVWPKNTANKVQKIAKGANKFCTEPVAM